MTGKIRRDVEAVLRWAYRDELPKSPEYRDAGVAIGASMHPMWRNGMFGGRVDNWHSEPGMPLALGEPHPDALLVAASVEDLGPRVFTWPDDRELLMPEFGTSVLPDTPVAVVSAETGRAVHNAPTFSDLNIDTRVYVVMFARMGERPDWQWRFGKMVGRNGKVKVEGLGRDGYVRAGAACPLMMEPEPRELARDRAIYRAWHEGLTVLADRLGESLASVAVRRPEASARPWVDPDPQFVVHPDLRPGMTLAALNSSAG